LSDAQVDGAAPESRPSAHLTDPQHLCRHRSPLSAMARTVRIGIGQREGCPEGQAPRCPETFYQRVAAA
jgi:hypothetical protein